MPVSIAMPQNRLLRELGSDDFTQLEPHLKRVRLTRGTALHPAGKAIEHIYFPESGMVSILTVMTTGQQIETAIVGNEGVVGGWVTINSGPSNVQSTVQVEGIGWQITTAKFLAMYKGSDGFSDAMNRYQGVILFQAQQSA